MVRNAVSRCYGCLLYSLHTEIHKLLSSNSFFSYANRKWTHLFISCHNEIIFLFCIFFIAVRNICLQQNKSNERKHKCGGKKRPNIHRHFYWNNEKLIICLLFSLFCQTFLNLSILWTAISIKQILMPSMKCAQITNWIRNAFSTLIPFESFDIHNAQLKRLSHR